MSGRLTIADTWRKWYLSVPPYSTAELVFTETKPNTFYVMNMNESRVLLGLSTIADESKFEYEIEKMNFDVFGRPTGSSTLYAYNPGAGDMHLVIYTYEGVFDANILKRTKIDADAIKFDGKITGFEPGASLPAGNNKIGTVGVTGLDGLLDDTNELVNGQSGKLEDIKVLLSDVKALIGQQTGQAIATQVKEFRGISTATASVCDFGGKASDVYIANEGAGTLTVTLKNVDGGSVGTLTLSSGERMNGVTLDSLKSVEITGTESSTYVVRGLV